MFRYPIQGVVSAILVLCLNYSCAQKDRTPAPSSVILYENNAGQLVPYDHKKQIDQLIALKNDGKELFLLMGRGNLKDGMQGPYKPLDTRNGKRVFVYGERDPKYVRQNDIPHLLMNFDDLNQLKTIPDEIFTAIAFDWSVVKFFRNLPKDAVEFYRMLRPGGKLYADVSIGGSMIATNNDQAEKICAGRERGTTERGTNYCLSNWDSALYILPGIVITSDENIIDRKRKSKTRLFLLNLFKGGRKNCLYKEKDYPIPENETQYFECTK